jgi:hypothetical protein
MKLKPALLFWLVRSLQPSFFIAPFACLWVLMRRDPLFSGDSDLQAFYILIHCIVIFALQSGAEGSRFGFLYTRGFSRDVLWSHRMLASAVAVLVVWLPAALLAWTGARSWVQDFLYQSPWYPLMAPREAWIPLAWLAVYAGYVPALHYFWIRAAAPARAGNDGFWLALAYGITLFAVVINRNRLIRADFFWPAVGVMTVLAIALLVAGRRLHRRLEVHA